MSISRTIWRSIPFSLFDIRLCWSTFETLSIHICILWTVCVSEILDFSHFLSLFHSLPVADDGSIYVWARARGFACASSRGQANWLSFPTNSAHYPSNPSKSTLLTVRYYVPEILSWNKQSSTRSLHDPQACILFSPSYIYALFFSCLFWILRKLK